MDEARTAIVLEYASESRFNYFLRIAEQIDISKSELGGSIYRVLLDAGSEVGKIGRV